MPVSGSAQKISFTFLRNNRIALTDDADLGIYLGASKRRGGVAEWRSRFERLAGSPVFAVIRQDAAAGAALAAQAPGGLRSTQLSSLLDQLQWITLAGKPENDRLRVVAEGECPAEATARQLADLLNGVVTLAETGLNDAKTRQQLDPATREAYLELLKSTDVSKIDRGDTKSVRLVFEITPKFLESENVYTHCVWNRASRRSCPHAPTPNLQFSVDSLVTHTTHNFTRTTDLMHEVEDARIYAGFHYHHSVIQGRVLGIKVGHQLMHRSFTPVR